MIQILVLRKQREQMKAIRKFNKQKDKKKYNSIFFKIVLKKYHIRKFKSLTTKRKKLD